MTVIGPALYRSSSRDEGYWLSLEEPKPEISLTCSSSRKRATGKAALLAKAAEIDFGLDKRVRAEIFGTLRRFTDQKIPIDRSPVTGLREFFAHGRAGAVERY